MQFTLAITVLLSLEAFDAVESFDLNQKNTKLPYFNTQRSVSTSGFPQEPPASLEQLVFSSSGAYLKSLSSYVSTFDEEEDADEAQLRLKREQLRNRMDSSQSTLVIDGSETLEQAIDNKYELTLTKPIGIEIQETQDGYVEVTGFTEKAQKLVKCAVKVGDRVLAVDSAFGGKLWPVSTVEGVTSACTGRLPGQSVRMQFERPRENIEVDDAELPMQMVTSAVITDTSSQVTILDKPSSIARPVVDENDLLSRCRAILRRYGADETPQNVKTRFVGKYALPAIVADKVMDSLCCASVSLDSVTLSMIMASYISCNQPEGALRAFEAAVGFPADGSINPAKDVIKGKDGGQIVPTEAALNLFTSTALLQAHAQLGDLSSVRRVLAALEGESGVVIGGLESAPWPFTGTYGYIQPDTKCYNIAISAAEKIGGKEALEMALSLFDKMSDPDEKVPTNGRPRKDIVTCNTLISALSNEGLHDAAFTVFDSMKRAGIKPDKYSFTPLIKGCVIDGEVEELLADMRDQGVETDVVTYNAMIQALCEKYKWTKATKLITEMECLGISPDSRTYGLLMNAMLKAQKPSACLTLFESACANERTSSFTENVHLYTTAITAASMLHDYERALDLVQRMTSNGVKPNLKTLTAVMGACLAAGRGDLAAKIYARIESPDGFAMSQGLRAMCSVGDLAGAASMLTEQTRGNRLMSGKEMMLSYQTVIVSALDEKNYSIARDMMTDLLSKDYIPGKKMFSSIFNVMGLFKAKDADLSEMDSDLNFSYLLFLVDSLAKKNLPIDGPLYTAILNLGNRSGGVNRKVASLVATAKNADEVGDTIFSSPDVDEREQVSGWEALLSSIISDDNDTLLLRQDQLPSLPVRVASLDLRRVVFAEKALAGNPRKKISSRKQK